MIYNQAAGRCFTSGLKAALLKKYLGRCGGTVYAEVSKTSGSNPVWVRFPPSAFIISFYATASPHPIPPPACAVVNVKHSTTGGRGRQQGTPFCANLSLNTVVTVEFNANPNPTIETLTRIAKTLSVGVDDLLK